MHPDEKQELLAPFLLELEAIQALPPVLKEKIIEGLAIITAEKEEVILSEGQVCKCVWVVLQGLVRAFHYVGETEVTSRLMKPHHIIISVESFYTQTPAFESLQAIEPTRLACMPYQRLDDLYHQFPSFNYTGRRLTEHYLYLTERRLYLLRKQKAGDKYKFFLEEYPNLINQIPLKYVASFLGINQETLCRVRNKIR